MNKWYDANGTDIDAYPNDAFKGGIYELKIPRYTNEIKIIENKLKQIEAAQPDKNWYLKMAVKAFNAMCSARNHSKFFELEYFKYLRKYQKVELVYKVTERAIPIFTHTTYHTYDVNRVVTIKSHNHYQNSEDDTMFTHGSFRYMDKEELVNIINKLTNRILLEDE